MRVKMDLALNNQQWLMCHKAKPNLLGFIGGRKRSGGRNLLMESGENMHVGDIQLNGDHRQSIDMLSVTEFKPERFKDSWLVRLSLDLPDNFVVTRKVVIY